MWGTLNRPWQCSVIVMTRDLQTTEAMWQCGGTLNGPWKCSVIVMTGDLQTTAALWQCGGTLNRPWQCSVVVETLLLESPGRRRLSKTHKHWRPPTDLYCIQTCTTVPQPIISTNSSGQTAIFNHAAGETMPTEMNRPAFSILQTLLAVTFSLLRIGRIINKWPAQ